MLYEKKNIRIAETKVYCSIFLSEPSAPPTSVHAYGTNVTRIALFWEQVPYIHRNGIIVGYKAELNKMSGALIETQTLDNTTFGTRFKNLVSFENYTVRVAALTSVGVGPFTKQIRAQTWEEGK